MVVNNNDKSDYLSHKGARDIQELILLPRAPSSFTLDRLPQMFPVCNTSRAKNRINTSLDFEEEEKRELHEQVDESIQL